MPRLSSYSHLRRKIDPARVFEARAELGLSQELLARRIGCSLGAVGGWERGIASPRRALVERLAEATGKSVEFFYADDEAAA